MKEQFFVSIDANFICESMDEVNVLIAKLRSSEIAKKSKSYNISSNIVKEPTCSKCNPFLEDNDEPIIKGHIN